MEFAEAYGVAFDDLLQNAGDRGTAVRECTVDPNHLTRGVVEAALTVEIEHDVRDLRHFDRDDVDRLELARHRRGREFALDDRRETVAHARQGLTELCLRRRKRAPLGEDVARQKDRVRRRIQVRHHLAELHQFLDALVPHCGFGALALQREERELADAQRAQRRDDVECREQGEKAG